jgi:hypothetical protein
MQTRSSRRRKQTCIDGALSRSRFGADFAARLPLPSVAIEFWEVPAVPSHQGSHWAAARSAIVAVAEELRSRLTCEFDMHGSARALDFEHRFLTFVSTTSLLIVGVCRQFRKAPRRHDQCS